eukprot:IDg3444t1
MVRTKRQIGRHHPMMRQGGARTGGARVGALCAWRACEAAHQQAAGQARLPGWLTVAPDCFGVSAPLVAQDGFGVRSLSVAMPHNEQADVNNMQVSAAAPRSVAAGVDAAASSQNWVPRYDQRVCIEAIMGGDIHCGQQRILCRGRFTVRLSTSDCFACHALAHSS